MTDKNTNRKLDALIDAVNKIAVPIPAIPPILPIPAIPAIPAIINGGDHDLIIKLDSKVSSLIISVDNLSSREDSHLLKTDFLARVIETDKIFGDHENRIRIVEVSITKILTWGAASLFLFGTAEGLLLHFWQ